MTDTEPDISTDESAGGSADLTDTTADVSADAGAEPVVEGNDAAIMADDADAAGEPVAEPAPEAAADDVAAAAPAASEEPTESASEEAAEPASPPAGVNADGEIVEVIDEEQLLAETAPRTESAYDRPGQWFVVHTQSGHEKKVKQNLEARIVSMNMEHRIYECVIPMEDVVEFKAGKKVVVQKKMFPGYLLVRIDLSDDSWYVVRQTPGITGFVHQGNTPVPLRRRDVEKFLSNDVEGSEDASKPARPRLEYELNESVRVKQGPFKDFTGEIVEINADQLKVKVLVNIFGRETPVELEFSQIAKL
jgi:transcriptional antiterminator NusG